MIYEKDDKPLDIKVVEEWLENFFLDPLTSYQDETIFRIDLFETDEEYIIEAMLPQINKSDITVRLDNETIIIDVATQRNNVEKKKQRMISFPFSIIHHDVHAIFEGGILEVFISKYKICCGKNREIKL
jgi:HSP20 family molecular chaperone IbpA